MIDTHCHLTDPRLLDQLDDVLARAGAAGVNRMITIGTDLGDSASAVALCQGREQLRCAIGIHPNYCQDAHLSELSRLTELANDPAVVALGEMGLDYHHRFADRSRQEEFFEAQLQIAVATELPVVIHSREAIQDTLALMRNFSTVRAVFHCFTGTPDEATRILDAGYMLGFDGPVTYKKSDVLREAVCLVPDDRLLVETDAPYLSPEPVRGQKINEPALVMHTARRIAALRGISLDVLDQITTANAARFFRWVGN